MAGIIRKEQLAAAQPFSLADLEQQGRQILQRARTEASQILQAAEQKGQQLAQQQEQAGYLAGLAAGREAGLRQVREEAHAAAVQDARDQVAALTDALGNLVDEFERNKRSLIAAAESGLIQLALAIARRVCKTTAAASCESTRANARALLQMVQHAGDVELHVHPAEHELLREMDPEWLSRSGQVAHTKLVADERVGRGACLLRTREGEIDAAIETQLDRIAAALLENTAPHQPTPAHPTQPTADAGE